MTNIHSTYGQELNSSMIKYAEYNPDLKELTVTFFNNEADYLFSNVEESIVQDFFSAESHGKYFNQNIKGNYNFTKL
jgi:hypothetical protein